MKMEIPLARPYTDEKEELAVAAVIRSGWVSQGPKVIEFEQMVADFVGARFAVATNSCTSALHVSLLLQGVKEGDEVICPAFTCMATANAIRHAGAFPVFVEIDPRTFNLDPNAVDRAVTPRTRAIMVVHQIGLAADMDSLREIARKHHLAIVEDAATALGGTYKGKAIGSLGSPTCFSFHPRKVITTGEGGMITTDDPDLAERARILRSHGASISDLERHKARGVIYAAYPEAGYNYRMTDMQAAMGIEQMKKLPWILERKREIARFYDMELARIPGVETPYVPDYAEHSYQSYLIRLPVSLDRDALLREMAARGISCRHGIAPLHLEPYYRRLYGEIHLPVTEEVSRRTLFLPIYPQMTYEELRYVVDNLRELVDRMA
ncbi:MAG: DegT/DnrJ/EryC1/StrS family aminotransferase [Chloroflexia bacterium]